jgi:large subunit ribosomal protein L20
MPRARKGAATRQSKVRWFKEAKGNRLGRSKQWRRVKGAVVRAGVYATRDRRQVKRNYRNLWIIRINAAVRARGMAYSRFVAGLKAAAILINRKMLSEIAIADPAGFDAIVELAKAGLAKSAAQNQAA